MNYPLALSIYVHPSYSESIGRLLDESQIFYTLSEYLPTPSENEKIFSTYIGPKGHLIKFFKKDTVEWWITQGTVLNPGSLRGKFIEIPENNAGTLLDTLDSLNRVSILKKVTESQRNCTKELNSWIERSMKYVDKSGLKSEKTFQQFYVKIIEMSEKLYLHKTLDKGLSYLKKWFKENSVIEDIKFVEKDNYEAFLELSTLKKNKKSTIFPILHSHGEIFLHYRWDPYAWNGSENEHTFFLVYLHHLIEQFFFFRSDNFSIRNRFSEIWEEAFTALPFPVALITSEGEVILHNNLFSRIKILPRDCLSFENLDKIDVDNEGFEVRVQDISSEGQELKFYSFMNQNAFQKLEEDKKSTRPISTEELGIISSSIAHELNNPIAGILAALSLLMLEDDLTEDAKNGILEMKDCANRIKELVDIFLGFSKASPNQKQATTLTSSFGQAMKLMRFRMIESDARLEIKINEDGQEIERTYNSSILSMVFYLVLNEILTAYSHRDLVAEKNSDKALRGYLEETEESIVLSLDHSSEIVSSVGDSKLIQHLVDLEGLNLKIEMNKITLSHWTLT
ncbi:MAG: hypothetical protein HN509_01415 [Halobacteriovoraceae bacterium]|jgi:signal transduction histidine kinase|nr:hypothetical protein [Halobacteriovoraceae bacterium]